MFDGQIGVAQNVDHVLGGVMSCQIETTYEGSLSFEELAIVLSINTESCLLVFECSLVTTTHTIDVYLCLWFFSKQYTQ